MSGIDVDFVNVAFDDSTIVSAQAALGEADLSVFDTYTIEWELFRRPVFSRFMSQDDAKVLAGKRAVISVRCLGKLGW